jgi:hypothetical protein
MEKFYFKKTWFGMKLMIQDRHPSGNSAGAWNYFYRKATEVESYDLFLEMMSMKKDRKLINQMNNNNPELFI